MQCFSLRICSVIGIWCSIFWIFLFNLFLLLLLCVGRRRTRSDSTRRKLGVGFSGRKIGMWYELRFSVLWERCASAANATYSGTAGNWPASGPRRRVRPSMATSNTSCAITREEEVTVHQSRPVNRSIVPQPLPLETTTAKAWVKRKPKINIEIIGCDSQLSFLVSCLFTCCGIFGSEIKSPHLFYLNHFVIFSIRQQAFVNSSKAMRESTIMTRNRKCEKEGRTFKTTRRFLFLFFLGDDIKEGTVTCRLFFPEFPSRPICIMICFGSFFLLYRSMLPVYHIAMWCNRWSVSFILNNRTRFYPFFPKMGGKISKYYFHPQR